MPVLFMIKTLHLIKQSCFAAPSEPLAAVERERERERITLTRGNSLLPFTSTIQRLGLSTHIHSICIQSLQKHSVSQFKLNQSLCNSCLSFFQKIQSLYKTYQTHCILKQSPRELNQSSQETIRKQWVLIVFCDFQLELSKNNWKREGLYKQRKGNTLQREGNNLQRKGLIWDAEGLICKPLLMTIAQLQMTNY